MSACAFHPDAQRADCVYCGVIGQQARIVELEAERDAAIVQIGDFARRSGYDLESMRQERDAAMAQVAVLAEALRHISTDMTPLGGWARLPSWAAVQSVSADLPAAAQALLAARDALAELVRIKRLKDDHERRRWEAGDVPAHIKGATARAWAAAFALITEAP